MPKKANNSSSVLKWYIENSGFTKIGMLIAKLRNRF